MVKEETKRLGWQETDLEERRKGDPGKVAVARRLWQKTTMSLKWIACRLQMGSWTYVSNFLAPKSGIENQQLCQHRGRRHLPKSAF